MFRVFAILIQSKIVIDLLMQSSSMKHFGNAARWIFMVDIETHLPLATYNSLPIAHPLAGTSRSDLEARRHNRNPVHGERSLTKINAARQNTALKTTSPPSPYEMFKPLHPFSYSLDLTHDPDRVFIISFVFDNFSGICFFLCLSS